MLNQFICQFIYQLTRLSIVHMSRIKLSQTSLTFIVLTFELESLVETWRHYLVFVAFWLHHIDDMSTFFHILQSHCPVFFGTCTNTTLSSLTASRPESLSSDSPSRRSSRFTSVSFLYCILWYLIHTCQSNAVHAHSEAPLWCELLSSGFCQDLQVERCQFLVHQTVSGEDPSVRYLICAVLFYSVGLSVLLKESKAALPPTRFCLYSFLSGLSSSLSRSLRRLWMVPVFQLW